jgi:hypothetical protein
MDRVRRVNMVDVFYILDKDRTLKPVEIILSWGEEGDEGE